MPKNILIDPSEVELPIGSLRKLLENPLANLFHQRGAYGRSWKSKFFEIDGRGASGPEGLLFSLFAERSPDPLGNGMVFLGYDTWRYRCLEQLYKRHIDSNYSDSFSKPQIAAATALAIADLPTAGYEDRRHESSIEHSMFPFSVDGQSCYLQRVSRWNNTKDHFFRRLVKALEAPDVSSERELNSDEVSATSEKRQSESNLQDTTRVLLQRHPSLLKYWLPLLVGVFSLPIFGVGLLIIVFTLVYRARNTFRITERRVTAEFGLIAKSQREIALTKVQGTKVTKPGLLGLLGIGTIEFASVTNDRTGVAFNNIANVDEVADIFRRAQDALA